MYTLLRLLPWPRLLTEQLPAMAIAWALAEGFYKWKSFTLETLGFLATWFVVDMVIQGARALLRSRAAAPGR